jgi:hypothetical protein
MTWLLKEEEQKVPCLQRESSVEIRLRIGTEDLGSLADPFRASRKYDAPVRYRQVSIFSNAQITSGCRNSWRRAAFQCTVTYGTFVK